MRAVKVSLSKKRTYGTRKRCVEAGGAVASESGRGLCECGKEFSKSYIARHRKSCRAVVTRLETEVVERQPRVYKRGVKVTCDCGAEVTKSNFSRHKREACPNGEAGP